MQGFLFSLAINFCIILSIHFSATALVRFFIDDEDVLYYGVLFLQHLNPFYIVVSITQIYSGALRGAGRTRAPMFIVLGSYVVFRQIYLFIMANFIRNEALPIAMGYPFGWLLAATLFLIVYHSRGLEHNNVHL